MTLTLYMVLLSFTTFIIFNNHFLMVLLSFELLMFVCFYLFVCSTLKSWYFTMSILFMVMMVCGGAYGLSILVYLSRSSGVDSLSMDN